MAVNIRRQFIGNRVAQRTDKEIASVGNLLGKETFTLLRGCAREKGQWGCGESR